MSLIDIIESPKNLRESDVKMKIMAMAVMASAYHFFSMRSLNASLIDSPGDYEGCELLATFASSLIDRPVKPDEFHHSNDELSNKAIEYDKKLNDTMVFFKALDISKDDIEAIFKSIYYGDPDGFAWFKFKADTDYPYIAEDILMFGAGEITREQFIHNFARCDIFKKKVVQLSKKDVVRVMKDGIWLLRFAQDIVWKRRMRKDRSVGYSDKILFL